MQDTQKIGEKFRLWLSLYQADNFSVNRVTPARNALPPQRWPGKKLVAKEELLVQTTSLSSYALPQIHPNQALNPTN